MTQKSGESGIQNQTVPDDVWYIAVHKLLIPNADGQVPSSLRIWPGQRFALDGDEAIDVEGMLRTGARKLYEESDASWAEEKLAEIPKPRRRRRPSGTNNS